MDKKPQNSEEKKTVFLMASSAVLNRSATRQPEVEASLFPDQTDKLNDEDRTRNSK